MTPLVAALGGTGCQPQDVRPGLWLRGERVEEHVVDWRFAGEVEEIFIETRPWYRIPHSTTIWCVELDGRLYIGSYGDQKKVWEKNIARNAEARLRVAGKIYEVTVTPVTDRNLIDALHGAYAQKYDMAEVFGDELPPWWYYRVAPRGLRHGYEKTIQFEDLAPELTFVPYSRQGAWNPTHKRRGRAQHHIWTEHPLRPRRPIVCARRSPDRAA
jgi:hypothetical protein